MIDIKNISTNCTRTEFVGTSVLDTIGLVISGIDDTLLREMNIGTKYHTLGLFSSRTGAAGQITAIDDAVKATNTEVLSIEFPRDTKGWGGHGNYIVIGGNDVSDVRHAIELALELTRKNAGEVYISESGHLEFSFSASAGAALQKAFHAVPGEAFGFMAGSPAAIGLVMADTAMKASAVSITCYMTSERAIPTKLFLEFQVMPVLSKLLSLKHGRSVWNFSSEWEATPKSPAHHICNFNKAKRSLYPHYLSNRQVMPDTGFFYIFWGILYSVFSLTDKHQHTVTQSSVPHCGCRSRYPHDRMVYQDPLLCRHFR